MKRIILLACAVMISIILLLILFPGPIVGLLGIEPVCIQGDLSHLRIVPCSEGVNNQPTVTPLPLPTLVGEELVPVIFDDDGSPDGLVALLYFLSHPSFDVKAVTLSCGEAHPDVFVPHLAQFLAGLERADIPVGAGRSTPLEGDNAFPEPWCQISDNFWNISLPPTTDLVIPQPATELSNAN